MRAEREIKRPRLAVMQPYFLPSMVYFQLVHAADIFVFLDDVQFVTKRWTHRNRLRIGETDYRFTVPLSGRSQNRNLDEIDIHPREYPLWRDKFLKTLRMHYGDHEAISELSDVLDPHDVSLADFAMRSVAWAAGRIGLAPQFLRSSNVDHDRDAGRTGRILSLCRTLDAVTYVNAAGGRSLYRAAEFEPDGIALRFIATGDLPGDMASVSILDPLLTLPSSSLRELAGAYTLEGERLDG